MLHHMLYSDMNIIYDIIYDIISYVVYYIIYELTVHGTDRNPSFDEYGVDIQHNGDRNLAAAMRLEASSAAVRPQPANDWESRAAGAAVPRRLRPAAGILKSEVAGAAGGRPRLCDWKPHFKWWMLFKTLNSVKGY